MAGNAIEVCEGVGARGQDAGLEERTTKSEQRKIMGEK